MRLSRRMLLRQVGAGAAAGAGLARTSLFLHASEPSPGPHAEGPVRLHLNENALGASPKAAGAIRDGGAIAAHRYPGSQEESLRSRLADFHAVSPGRVVLGSGSSEILRMAAAAFSGSGRKVIVALPTFDAISDAARRAGTEVVSVPLRSDHAHDLDEMLARTGADTGLVYLCNPNNPTGSLTRRGDLETFLNRLPPTAYVLMDEAYHHYVSGSSEYTSFLDRPVDNARLIVARSFSTIHGLAGLRIGYAVTHADTARLLAACRVPDSVSGVAATAAVAALEDRVHVRMCANRNADDRQEFCNQANARMLKTVDSHANFVMLNTGRPAVSIVDHFATNRVLVAGPFHGYEKYIRVSLGTPVEMRDFWRVWDLLPLMRDMTM
jgi:histidinol-phosphate aminotransferase